MPVIVLDVKRGAGRAAGDRVIIGAAVLAAEAAVVVKLSTATQANKTSFVFMIFDLSNHWTPRRRWELLMKAIAKVTRQLPWLAARPAVEAYPNVTVVTRQLLIAQAKIAWERT